MEAKTHGTKLKLPPKRYKTSYGFDYKRCPWPVSAPDGHGVVSPPNTLIPFQDATIVGQGKVGSAVVNRSPGHVENVGKMFGPRSGTIDGTGSHQPHWTVYSRESDKPAVVFMFARPTLLSGVRLRCEDYQSDIFPHFPREVQVLVPQTEAEDRRLCKELKHAMITDPERMLDSLDPPPQWSVAHTLETRRVNTRQLFLLDQAVRTSLVRVEVHSRHGSTYIAIADLDFVELDRLALAICQRRAFCRALWLVTHRKKMGAPAVAGQFSVHGESSDRDLQHDMLRSVVNLHQQAPFLNEHKYLFLLIMEWLFGVQHYRSDRARFVPQA